MRLGAFYGLTAPFVLMLYETKGDEKFMKYVSIINNPVDHTWLEEAKQEVLCFKNAIESLPRKLSLEIPTDLLEKFAGDELVNGKPISAGETEQGQYELDLRRYCLVEVIKMLGTKKYKNSLDLDVLQGDLRVVVNDFINKIFAQDGLSFNKIKANLAVYVRKIGGFINRSKSFSPLAQEKVYNDLLDTFSLSQQLDASNLGLSKEEERILEWFIMHEGSMNRCIEVLGGGTTLANERLFNQVDFRDLVYSKPRRLIGVLASCYNTAGNAQKIGNFMELNKSIKADLDLFTKLFQESVISDLNSETAVSNKMHSFDLVDTVANTALQYNSSLYKQLDEDKYVSLMELSQAIEGFSMAGLNEFFGTELSVSDWEDLISSFNSLGLYGFNFYSATLFFRTFKEYSFDTTYKVVKDAESIKEYEGIIALAKAYTDSILPTGTRI